MPLATANRGGIRFSVFAGLVVLYFSAPGHRELLVHGLPLGPEGTAIVAAVVVLGVVFRGVRIERRAFTALSVVVALLLAGRVGLGLWSTPQGWTARYVANETGTGAPEWSSDFRNLDATRIDRRIAFHDDTFPAHYLNDYKFSHGDRREVTEPMSVEWRAFASGDSSRTIRIVVRARGDAAVAVDGRSALSTSAAKVPRTVETTTTLSPGTHELLVRYLKPADVDGLIDVQAIETDGSAGLPASLALTPWPADRRRSDLLLPFARALDAILLLLFAVTSAYGGRQLWRSGAAAGADWLTLALCALFGVQGWRQAIPFAGRVRPLMAGDDWWGFEACARDILHHGPLMTLGRPIGQADPYFYHPLYSYFLAAVHGVSGESFFGPVFVQFLILAVVAAIMWSFAQELFGTLPACAGVAALVLLFELDFVRYYTVTLLSENIYVLTVPMAVLPFSRWMRTGARADLVRMGIWGGVSTVTRPPMLLYLFPALALIVLVSTRRARRLGAALAPAAITATTWIAVVALTALRNIVVAHRWVLVSDVQSSSVLTYNIPASVSAAEYGARWRGTFGSAFYVISQMAWEHPRAMLGVALTKIGFSLGMIHWAGGYRPHPELIAITALYLTMCLVSASMRSRPLWPVHLFVVVHVASMLLTMPWNYGYRMILPPFVFTTTVGVAAFTSWAINRRLGAGRSSPIEARA
jgi:dolichyl-phosphate-mannose-protein mannosyltransferase